MDENRASVHSLVHSWVRDYFIGHCFILGMYHFWFHLYSNSLQWWYSSSINGWYLRRIFPSLMHSIRSITRWASSEWPPPPSLLPLSLSLFFNSEVLAMDWFSFWCGSTHEYSELVSILNNRIEEHRGIMYNLRIMTMKRNVFTQQQQLPTYSLNVRSKVTLSYRWDQGLEFNGLSYCRAIILSENGTIIKDTKRINSTLEKDSVHIEYLNYV